MNKKIAQELVDKTRQDYNKIGTHFSSTRSYNWPDVEAALEKLNPKKGDKVLDLGCGNGRLIKALEKYGIDYTGLDISEKLIEIANKNFPKLKFVRSDLTKTSFKDNQFDTVVSIATLHHIPAENRQLAFTEINRILKPDGDVLISVWYFWNKPEYLKLILSDYIKKLLGKSELGFGDFYKDWKDDKQQTIVSRYFHAWTRHELKKYLNESGFTNIDFVSFDKIEQKRNLIISAKKKNRDI